MQTPLDTDQSAKIYSDQLIKASALAETPRRLENPSASATAVSPICGSVVTIDLVIDGDFVRDFGFEVEACALTKTVVSVMDNVIRSQTREEIRAAGLTLEKMLRENGAPPTGVWAGLALLEPVRDFRARHNSILLPFEAIERAFKSLK